MEKIKNIGIWEKENDSLVEEIKDFCKKYKKKYKDNFLIDEFKAHEKMLGFSSKIFKNRIDEQVKKLLEIKSSLTT